MKPICKLLALGFCAGALFTAFSPTDAAKGHAKHATVKKKHHPKGTDANEAERVKYTFQKIQMPSVKNSSAMADNWQTGSKRPKHHPHPSKAGTTSTGRRVWQPVQKFQIDNPNVASKLVNAQKTGSKPTHPHHKKK